MKVAYLVNQYPHVSHSFIRREIAALEHHGVEVDRYSIRASGEDLVDEGDRQEQRRTEVLLSGAAHRSSGSRHRHGSAATVPDCTAGRGKTGAAFRPRRGSASCLSGRGLLARPADAPNGADHLHAHFGTNPTSVALLAHLLSGVPYSFTVHGPEEFDKPEGLSLPEKIARAAFVVAISDFGRSQLFRWCAHGDWRKIHVVRCGVDGSFLRAESKPVPEAARLVCVGRLCEQKGALLLLEALAPLAAEGIEFHLTLAGDGPLRPVIEEQIQRLGLSARVHITGWISNRTVREEIQSARLFLLPSFAEGLPVVLMEALALGQPVITTFVAGIPELVRAGENGWLVPAGNVSALTDAVREALETPTSVLAQLGRAGASRVAAQHNAVHEAEKLARLFAPLPQPRQQPARTPTKAISNARIPAESPAATP